MNKEQEKVIIEWGILISLFKATCEQQTMLYGKTAYESKMIFNQWVKQGDRLMKIIEKTTNMDQLDAVSDVIHDAVHQIRKANNV